MKKHEQQLKMENWYITIAGGEIMPIFWNINIHHNLLETINVKCAINLRNRAWLTILMPTSQMDKNYTLLPKDFFPNE